MSVGSLVNKVLAPLRVQVRRVPSEYRYRRDLDDENIQLIERVRPFTLTTDERIVALADSVRHIARRHIPGAFVECGVWRGGSSMAMALELLAVGVERDLYLFDTFAGMTESTSVDQSTFGRDGADYVASMGGELAEYLEVSRTQVQENMSSTGYPMERVRLVEGPVEDTLPDAAPDEIALLRLDTDWYESTKHELEHLYPRLATGGVLIIDDYGSWAGARKAVDEYFAAHDQPPLLFRIDASSRMAVKP